MLQRHAIKNKWRRVQRPIGICEPTKKRAHIAFCLNDGSVYSESYSNSPVHPASLTKLMTLCIALDLLKSGRLDLEEDIIFSRRSQKFHSPNSGFKSATFNDVLNLICVASANDAAVAVAEHIGRTEWRFCHEFMNPKARSLGMKNSEFWNATGLLNHDLPYSRPLPHSVTTASDLMVLVSYILNNHPDILERTSMKEVQLKRRNKRNINSLLYDRDVKIDGLKTGTLEACGFHLIATGREYGRRVVAISLGNFFTEQRFKHCKDLLIMGLKARAPSSIEVAVNQRNLG